MTNGPLLSSPLHGSAYQVRVKLVNEIGLPIHVNIWAGLELTRPVLRRCLENCDPAVIHRHRCMSRDIGIVFRNWSGARDLNPGPHGPEI
jgi:hypothetical protein